MQSLQINTPEATPALPMSVVHYACCVCSTQTTCPPPHTHTWHPWRLTINTTSSSVITPSLCCEASSSACQSSRSRACFKKTISYRVLRTHTSSEGWGSSNNSRALKKSPQPDTVGEDVLILYCSANDHAIS